MGNIKTTYDHFASIVALLEHLINGGKAINIHSNCIYYLKDNHLYREYKGSKEGNQSISFIEPYYYFVPYKEPKWYDNIPKEGVLCWVWDDHEKNKIIDVVTCFNKIQYFETLSDGTWLNAIPLTIKEIVKFTYRGINE